MNPRDLEYVGRLEDVARIVINRKTKTLVPARKFGPELPGQTSCCRCYLSGPEAAVTTDGCECDGTTQYALCSCTPRPASETDGRRRPNQENVFPSLPQHLCVSTPPHISRQVSPLSSRSILAVLIFGASL